MSTKKTTSPALPDTMLTPLSELRELSVTERINAAHKGQQLSVIGAAYAGAVLLDLKADMPHGEFSAALTASGWQTRSAQNYMAFAEMAKHIEATNAKALSLLTMHQWLALRDMPEGDLKRFVSGQEINGLTLQDASTLSLRDLQEQARLQKLQADAIITKQQKALADLETKLDTAEQEKRQLRERLEKKRTDFVATLREESSAFAAEANIKIEAMETLLSELQDISATSRSKEHQHNCRIAGATLYQNARMLAARASQLLQQLLDALPAEATESEVDSELVFTEEEIDIAVRNHRDMVAAHAQEIAIRETQREMNKPRKAGRPAKKK